MTETIIYWVGAIAIISVLAVISAMAIMILSMIITSHLVKELKSTYNHCQLRRLMQRLKKDGLDEVYKGEVSRGSEKR